MDCDIRSRPVRTNDHNELVQAVYTVQHNVPAYMPVSYNTPISAEQIHQYKAS